MDFRELTYVLAIAEEGGISKAARKLYISQPSLSRYLRDLEIRLGTPLFNRAASPLAPTYAGRLYVEKARQILNLREQLQREFEDVGSLRKGQIVLGISGFRAGLFFPKVLPRFRAQYPGIKIVLREGEKQELLHWIVKGQADLGILILDPRAVHDEGIDFRPILSQDLYLALPPEHPISLRENTAPRVPWVDLGLLAEERFILMAPGFTIRDISDRLFREAGYTPDVILETRGSETAASLVASGMGASFLPSAPYVFAKGTPQPAFFAVGTPPAMTTLALAWGRDRYLSKASQAFIETTEESFGV